MLAIFRLWFNLEQLYKMCGVFFVGIGGWEGEERDLVVTIVGTLTWGCYKWIIISCLCTYARVCYHSYASCIPTVLLGVIWLCSTVCVIYTDSLCIDVLLTVHLSIFISVINRIDTQNFCFTVRLFRAPHVSSTMCSSWGGQNCITQPLVSSHL